MDPSKNIVFEEKYKRTSEQKYNYTQYTMFNYPFIMEDLLGPAFGIANSPYKKSMQVNQNTWIKPNDFGEQHIPDDDGTNIVIIQSGITSLFDEIIYIINESLIDPTDLDDKFKNYLKCASNAIQIIMNSMFECKWNFEPLEKFAWIYIMLACKYEPRAIKYLANSPYFAFDMFKICDRNNYFPLLHAIMNKDFDIAVLHELLTPQILNEAVFGKYPLICYAIYNTKTFEYIYANIPEVSLIKYDDFTYNPFIFACSYNTEVAKLMLEKRYVTKEMIPTITHNKSCLMYTLLTNHTVFKMIMESDLCSQELIDVESEIFGNILTLAIHKKPEMVDYILNSKYMSSKLLKGHVKYKGSDTNVNILLQTCKNIELFGKIINHEKFTQDVFDEIFSCVPIHELAELNPECIKLLFDKNYLNEDHITKKYDTISLLFYGIKYNVKILELICEYKWSSDYILMKFDTNGKNMLMQLLENCDDESNKLITALREKNLIKPVQKEFFESVDNEGYNGFWYSCIYFQELINDINVDEYLSLDVIKSLCYHWDPHKKLHKTILSKLTTDDTNKVDENGNNFFMEQCMWNIEAAEMLYEMKLINQITLEQINIDGNNALLLLLNANSYGCDSLLKKLIESDLINAKILNHVNKKGNNLLLLACQFQYDWVKFIFDSPHFDKNTFANVNNRGINCFTKACCSGDKQLLEFICENELFTEKMFTSFSNSGLPYIANIFNSHLIVGNSIDEYVGYVLNHKYCNELLLIKLCEYLISFESGIKMIKYLLDSKYCTEELLETVDANGDNILANAIRYDNEDLIHKIVESKHVTKRVFSNVNKKGNNFMNYIGVKTEIMELLLKCDAFDNCIFEQRNEDGSSYLNTIAENSKYELLEKILESGKYSINALKCNGLEISIMVKLFALPKHITKLILKNSAITNEDLRDKDVNGNTCLHYAAKRFWNQLANRNKMPTLKELNEEYSEQITEWNEILNMELCSTQLLEMTNKDGNTYLQIIPFLLEVTLQSKFCTQQLLKNKNNMGETIFAEIYLTFKEYLEMFLNHKLFDSSFLSDKIGNKNIQVISSVCISAEDETVNLILKKCTNDIINSVDSANATPLIYTILSRNTFMIKTLLESEFDLTKTFNHNYKGIFENESQEYVTLLMIAISSTEEIFQMILNSKYITHDMFLKCDKFNHNVVIYAINNLDKIKAIIMSKYWNNDLMYWKDIDDDYLFRYPYDKPKIVAFMLESNKCDKKMLLMKNKMGRNCAYYYAKHNTETLDILLNNPLCDSNIISDCDNFGDTPIHIACQCNCDSVIKLLNSKHLNPKVLLKKNKKGKIPLMLLLENNAEMEKSENVLKVYDKISNKTEMMTIFDNDGNNLLFYAIKYNIKLLPILLSNEICNENYLKIRNNDNMTCHMYGSRYNGESLKYLMENKFTTDEMLSHSHMDYGSCVTIAARYQPIAIKYILGWKNISFKTLYTIFEKMNFMSIACTYNADSVKYAIESNVNLEKFIENGDAFMNACRYQPDAVKYILNSKYATSELITKKINGRSPLDEAYDLQPKSLIYILQSKFKSDELLNFADERGYRLLFKIKKIFPEVQTIDDIANINLTKYVNECAQPGEKTCDICFTFKQSIVLIPCCHVCCLGCAFKINKCYSCRGPIEKRNYIYC